jgi:hypothetical protein
MENFLDIRRDIDAAVQTARSLGYRSYYKVTVLAPFKCSSMQRPIGTPQFAIGSQS